MSATIAAALKKIAVALLTNPKALKTILGIVLGILLIIIMPIAAVLGIFSGAVEIDTSRFLPFLGLLQAITEVNLLIWAATYPNQQSVLCSSVFIL